MCDADGFSTIVDVFLRLVSNPILLLKKELVSLNMATHGR